jgi:transporter family protein
MMQVLYWLPATLVSLICFGFWGFFSKLAILHINAKSALVYQSLGFALVGLITLALLQFKLDVQLKGIGFATLAGMSTSLGCLFFFIAADKGKVTTVVTMTALYPIITILLAYLILQESVNLKQGLGIALALVAIYLLSG